MSEEKTKWNQKRIESYIDGVEESTTLDYKGAGGLDKSPGKKKDIAIDVSAMAITAGGFIIYGLKEYDEDGKKHNNHTDNYCSHYFNNEVSRPSVPFSLSDSVLQIRSEGMYLRCSHGRKIPPPKALPPSRTHSLFDE